MSDNNSALRTLGIYMWRKFNPEKIDCQVAWTGRLGRMQPGQDAKELGQLTSDNA